MDIWNNKQVLDITGNVSIKEKKYEALCNEVYFVNESYFGDEIKIFKKKIKNQFYIEGKTGDKTIFRSVLKLKK